MTTLFCLIAATSLAAAPQQHQTIYPSNSPFEMAIRGQSADPFFSGSGGMTTQPTFGNQPSYPGTIAATPTAFQGGMTGQPFPSQGMDSFYTNPTAPTYDPFLTQSPLSTASPFGPYGGAPIGTYALNGPQPYRFGWSDRISAGYIFGSGTEDENGVDTGDMAVFELDIIKEYVTQGAGGYIWKVSPEFNYREWTGPGSPNLPPNVYRLAAGVELTTPKHGPWTAQFGVKPQLASDFNANFNSNAWMFDTDIKLFYQQSPELTWAIGAMYWDRVDDIVLPFGGLIWTPNQNWEWRLIFPNPRVDVFLGNWYTGPTWFYVGAEYHVESYQVTIDPTDYQDQIQLEDWRAFIGLRGDTGTFAHFIEVGVVFGREAEFRREEATPSFDTDPGLLLRGGVRF